jgi:hypothetical protein
VPTSDNQSPEHRRMDWPAILRTLLVQVLVLLALASAVVGYLDWSSEVSWAEFVAASKSSTLANHRPHSSLPVQTVKDQAFCRRKG